MYETKIAVRKDEITEVAEILSVFQQLPPIDRIAIMYYLKGKVDEMAGEVHIPTVGLQPTG